jgi:Bacterial archaeo-eukaryotic release factor family 11
VPVDDAEGRIPGLGDAGAASTIRCRTPSSESSELIATPVSSSVLRRSGFWVDVAPMILPTDIPTRAQLERLLAARDASSVSIYLPTNPSSRGDAERIELKNLAREARTQLDQAGAARADVAAIDDELADLVDDDELWRYQARSLALFLTPTMSTTFRLPHNLVAVVEVSDRFHLKPLLRALTFPHTAFVLALSQNSVRLLEIAPELETEEIQIPDLPKDVASTVGKSSIRDRAPSGRIQGSEGQKTRMRQYARRIDQALRPLLNGLDLPLILAATDPMDSIYRTVNSYPNLVAASLPGNPEATSDAQLIESARRMLDDLYAAELRKIQETYALRASQRRASADIADVARAATHGLVDTVLVDIDEVVPGRVEEETGAVTFDDADDAVNYGVVDEIARRVWLKGGKVLAVRREDIPGKGSVAAILRYAP